MKKIIVGLLAFIVMLASCVSVNAASDTITMSLTSNKTEFKAGDTVVVYLKVAALNGNIIHAIDGNLSYDTSIFNAISSGSLNAGTGRSVTFDANQNNRIYIAKTSESGIVKADNTTILTMTFVAKKDASFSKAEFSFTTTVATDNDNEFSANKATLTLTKSTTTVTNTVVTNTTVTNTTVTNTAPVANKVENTTVTNTAVPSTVANTTAKNTAVANTTGLKESVLPKTGAAPICLGVMSVLSAVAGVFFYKYKKIK